MYVIKMDSKPNHEYAKELLSERMSRGIRINEGITELRAEIDEDFGVTLENLNMEYGIINPNSPKQVSHAFNQILRHEHLPHTIVSNKQTFKKEVLIQLSLLGYELADVMRVYRKQKKLLEYIDSLSKGRDEEGLIHPEISTGKTNRFNYSKPALMNIPKEILWKSIAPYKENTTLYSVDIKQQEPWIIVNMLDIKQLKELIKIHGDFYTALYIAIFDKEIERDIQRREIKIAWNSMAYGASPDTVKAYCRNLDGEKVYKYFSNIPEYKKFKSRAYGLAKKKIQSIQTLFGTELYASEWNTNALARVLMDIPIQGTGTDILVMLMGHFMDSIEQDGLTDVMDIYYTRHDEIIVEVSNTIKHEQAEEYLLTHLEHKVEGWEPFRVKVSKVVELASITDMSQGIDEL